MKQRFVVERKWLAFLFVMMGYCLFPSCKKENPIETQEDVNGWIYKVMKSYYLWYDEIPSENSLDFSLSPDHFFESLLSDQDGKANFNGRRLYFSTIKNTETTKAGTSDSYGFNYVSYYVANANYYRLLVLYVYPGSPADEAGLKRGDWIQGLNGNVDNITDYTLFQKGGKAVEITVTRYNPHTNKLEPTRSVTMAASRQVEEYPFLMDSVYHLDAVGKRVGYLVYNNFTPGTDSESNLYDTQMQQLFTRFKASRVNEFILDLRYNGGGAVTSARLLSSLLAPASALGKTFCTLEYNDQHTNENESLLFKKSSEIPNANLNLQRLYVLVDEYTASASELVINSLIPYMGRENITLIGTQTIGKSVGSRAFGGKEGLGWVLQPIILRVYNAEHKADYPDGFVPDEYLDELKFSNYIRPYGDVNDLCLNVALGLISGQSIGKATLRASTPVDVYPVRSSFIRPTEPLWIDDSIW